MPENYLVIVGYLDRIDVESVTYAQCIGPFESFTAANGWGTLHAKSVWREVAMNEDDAIREDFVVRPMFRPIVPLEA